MSCIAGQFRRDGAGGDRRQIEQMLAVMKARAPDGDELLCEGPAALGQAFLRTGRSGPESANRLTLDGTVWIAADARIDARAALVRRLRTAGRAVPQDAPHAELILHAYHAFGDAFVDHLLGDFAFALWDSHRHTLICVRDQFGVRPFYYAEIDGVLSFASDIEGLLAVPTVPRQLDDTAVADFLLLGMCTKAEQTIYRAIRCLPPATRLDVTPGGAVLRKYWELPTHAETRYPTRAQYVERFTELFEEAVRDRLPDGPVALQLTGGMDSTSIAAVAAAWSRESGHPVTGYHLSSRSVEPEDHEDSFAAMVAEYLGIRLVRQDVGDYPLFSRSNEPALQTAFPLSYPQLAAHHDTLAQVTGSGARVLFSGYSGDSVMSPRPTYYTDLLRRLQLPKFAREVRHHLRLANSPRGLGLRTMLRRTPAPPDWKPDMPHWIARGPDLPVDLDSRWNGWWAMHESAVDAAGLLSLPWVHRQFEALEILKLPVVGRYPFHDLRLVRFLLGLPNFMLQNKSILRDAMRGRLPEVIRTRPKTAAAGDFVRTMVTNGKVAQRSFGVEASLPSPIQPEVFREALEKYCRGERADSTWASWLMIQSIAFGIWVSHQQELAQ